MDCLSMGSVGYVAISNTIENDVVDLDEASPVFQVTADSVTVVQYFSMPFQNKIYLRFVWGMLQRPNLSYVRHFQLRRT